jgi:hypothetical protein
LLVVAAEGVDMLTHHRAEVQDCAAGTRKPQLAV